MKKRSNAPIFWALFGAGGMLAALTGPALVFMTARGLPLRSMLPADMLSYHNMQAFAQHGLGKLFLLAIVVLYMWHAAHRIYKSLHDVGIHPGPVPKAVCYGSALVASVLAAGALLAVGF